MASALQQLQIMNLSTFKPRSRVAFFVFLTACMQVSCGSDARLNPTSSRPGEPGVSALWNSVTEKRECGATPCPGAQGFTVTPTGKFSGSVLGVGQITAAELADLNAATETVITQSLIGSPTCSAQATAVATPTLINVVPRTRPDLPVSAPVFSVYQDTADGLTCTLGNFDKAQALRSVMDRLTAAYDKPAASFSR